jgi:hypothetical protein
MQMCLKTGVTDFSKSCSDFGWRIREFNLFFCNLTIWGGPQPGT